MVMGITRIIMPAGSKSRYDLAVFFSRSAAWIFVNMKAMIARRQLFHIHCRVQPAQGFRK